MAKTSWHRYTTNFRSPLFNLLPPPLAAAVTPTPTSDMSSLPMTIWQRSVRGWKAHRVRLLIHDHRVLFDHASLTSQQDRDGRLWGDDIARQTRFVDPVEQLRLLLQAAPVANAPPALAYQPAQVQVPAAGQPPPANQPLNWGAAAANPWKICVTSVKSKTKIRDAFKKQF
jgi:hypothetical protein